MHICVCVNAGTCTHTSVCMWRSEVNCGHWPLPSTLVSLLCFYNMSFQEFLEILLSLSLIFSQELWDFRHLHYASSFYMGPQNSNSGLRAHMANTYPLSHLPSFKSKVLKFCLSFPIYRFLFVVFKICFVFISQPKFPLSPLFPSSSLQSSIPVPPHPLLCSFSLDTGRHPMDSSQPCYINLQWD